MRKYGIFSIEVTCEKNTKIHIFHEHVVQRYNSVVLVMATAREEKRGN